MKTVTGCQSTLVEETQPLPPDVRGLTANLQWCCFCATHRNLPRVGLVFFPGWSLTAGWLDVPQTLRAAGQVSGPQNQQAALLSEQVVRSSVKTGFMGSAPGSSGMCSPVHV